MARKARREILTPELTPLIDVVFLLLIFFLVSSVFKKEELALLLTLPKSEQGKGEAKAKKDITIEMTGDKLALESKEITLDELSSKLSSMDLKTLINLRVDGEVKYQRLVKILDILQKNKLENVSLITEKNKK